MAQTNCDRCGNGVTDVGPVVYKGQIKLCGRCTLEYWVADGDGKYTRKDLARHLAARTA